MEKGRVKKEWNNLSAFSDIGKKHAQYPKNNYQMKEYNGIAEITGPCGDTMEMRILVKDEIITDASFITDGCASSHACGSATVSIVLNINVNRALNIRQNLILGFLEGLHPNDAHCALLAANTMRKAVENFMNSCSE